MIRRSTCRRSRSSAPRLLRHDGAGGDRLAGSPERPTRCPGCSIQRHLPSATWRCVSCSGGRPMTPRSPRPGCGDDGRPDRGHPRRPAPRWPLGEARPGLRHEVPRHCLAADVPRPARCRSGRQRVQRACAYVVAHSQTDTGGFGASGRIDAKPPPPSAAIHCLNGNLLRALIGFGWLDDERVQRAIDWQARTIAGEGVARWYASGTCGPGFACAANERLPCAWGAIKALLGLARIPSSDARRWSAGPSTAALPSCSSRSGRGRLSRRLGQHAAEWFVVQARLPVRLCGRRPPEPRGTR